MFTFILQELLSLLTKQIVYDSEETLPGLYQLLIIQFMDCWLSKDYFVYLDSTIG